MKKVLALLFLGLILAVSNAQAHCGKCGVGDAAHDEAHSAITAKVDAMTAELGLTAEQKEKLSAIMAEKMQKKQAIMDDKMSSMDALHEEFVAKLKTVLTPEQMAKWEAAKAAKGDMKAHCPMCKDGKMCEMCEKAMKADMEKKK